jgi:phospholipase/carboxylesterase
MSTMSYIHTSLPAPAGSPLLFLFHGTGGDENQFRSLGRSLMPGAGIVSPRGDVFENGAARFFRRKAEGVYDMGDLALRTKKMADFVRAHRDEAKPSSVLGLGYSNGANILASVIFHDPTLFDAAVLMHPLIPFAPIINGDLAGKKILVTAGGHDPISPEHMTHRLEAHLRATKASVTITWHGGAHELRPSEIEAARQFFAPYAARPKEQNA